ncbi:hypothetical protein F383_19839 [Gossypium arboreum]|uniref:Uncharacterized protein n=1 Tax=Gossypium arboreum TaxID=29729 RepID=A0A0B0NKU2_GOSAR|nr:hypothetical protein F383_19839 [Gossypium arboreum]
MFKYCKLVLKCCKLKCLNGVN